MGFSLPRLRALYSKSASKARMLLKKPLRSGAPTAKRVEASHREFCFAKLVPRGVRGAFIRGLIDFDHNRSKSASK